MSAKRVSPTPRRVQILPVRSARRTMAVVTVAVLTGVSALGGCSASGTSETASVDAGAPEASSGSPAAPERSERSSSGSATAATGSAAYLSQAAEATAAVDTMKMSMTFSMEGMEGVDGPVMSYQGEFDAAGRAHLTLDMGGVLGPLLGDEDALAFEMVVDGGVAYVRSEMLTGISDGKPWMRVPVDELADAGSLGSGAGLGLQEPGSFLQFLEGAGDEVETVGPDEVRGVAVTHVRTDVDIAGLVAEADSAAAAELEDTLAQLGATGIEGTMPVDAWIDDQQMVRRIRIGFDMGGLLGGLDPEAVPDEMTGASMVLEVEFYDFGEPVEIVVPDPSEVGELDQLTGDLFES